MYWEEEITDREFDELMLFLEKNKELGKSVGLNVAFDDRKNFDISINSLREFWDMRDEISRFLEENAKEEYQEICQRYKDSNWKNS